MGDTLFDTEPQAPAHTLPRHVLDAVAPRVPVPFRPPDDPALVKVADDRAERTIAQQFEAFHLANPEVYRRLVKLARELVAHGVEREGIGHLWEVMRWQFRLETIDGASDFRLNNNYRSRYARLIMDTEPDLRAFFELRRLRAS